MKKKAKPRVSAAERERLALDRELVRSAREVIRTNEGFRNELSHVRTQLNALAVQIREHSSGAGVAIVQLLLRQRDEALWGKFKGAELVRAAGEHADLVDKLNGSRDVARAAAVERHAQAVERAATAHSQLCTRCKPPADMLFVGPNGTMACPTCDRETVDRWLAESEAT